MTLVPFRMMDSRVNVSWNRLKKITERLRCGVRKHRDKNAECRYDESDTLAKVRKWSTVSKNHLAVFSLSL